MYNNDKNSKKFLITNFESDATKRFVVDCFLFKKDYYGGDLKRIQNVELEKVKPKPINSHDMVRYGDMDIFLMQQAAT